MLGLQAARAPQHRREPREDDVDVGLFARERIGARVERADLGGRVIRARQQQARRRAQRGIEADPADHVISRHVGHHAVDDDRAGALGGREPQAIEPGRSHHRLVARARQTRSEALAKRHAVVDHQHAARRRRAIATDERRIQAITKLVS